ncbi:MAG: acyl-CoA reductase [Akkermansiaceae bacterium]
MNHPIQELAQSAELFAPFTGVFDEAGLRSWLARELTPPPGTRFLYPETIVHIISGNTPHAAWQSLLAGLLLGSKNRLKLPSNALSDFEKEMARLPLPLREKIETSRLLPDDWITTADALIVYGNDATLSHFRNLAPLEIPFIAHGHRVGVALIEDPSEEAARLAAQDIYEFDQNGCLSLQTIYVNDPRAFAPLLAAELEKAPPRAALSASEHGAISNLRLETRYLAAQDPENHALWQSENSTTWTIILRDTTGLEPSPGNRTVFLKPLSRFQNSRHLSGIGLHPFKDRPELPSPRLFPLGQAQDPGFAWAHDGLQTLRSLTRLQTSEKNTHPHQ